MSTHDAGYKLLFAHPELVHELLRSFGGMRWIGRIRPDALERVNNEYVSEHLSGRRDDLVWRAQLGGKNVYIYILLEFQSGLDRWMALRMQVYGGLLYQDLLRRKELAPGGLLPPLFPLVFYNGVPPWNAQCELGRMVAPAPRGAGRFQVSQRYCVIDQRRLDRHALEGNGHVLSLLFQLELAQSPAVLRQVLVALAAWFEQDPQAPLRRSVRAWLGHQVGRCVARLGVHIADLAKELAMSEMKEFVDFGEMLVYHGREEGLAQGRAEGRAEGKAEGQREVLRLILAKRFGPLPPHLVDHVGRLPPERLGDLLGRAIEAPSLGMVFDEAPGD